MASGDNEVRMMMSVYPGAMTGFAALNSGLVSINNVFGAMTRAVDAQFGLINTAIVTTGTVVTQLGIDAMNAFGEFEQGMKIVQMVSQQTGEDIDYLKTNHEDNPYYLAIAFNFYAGMRLGELLAIKNADIKNGCISINGQINKEIDLNTNETSYYDSEFVKGYTEQGFRTIPLNEDALAILKKAREINPSGEYVFMIDGKPLNPDTYNTRLRRLCIKLGLEPRSSHSLRFTFASILYYNGISIYNISKLLGHTDITMTQRYINDIMPSEELYNSVRAAL